MGSDTLAIITFASNYLLLAGSLWMAFFLLARGFGSPITMRVVLALGAVSLHAYNAAQTNLNPALNNEPLREFAFVLALAAWYHVSYYLLPPGIQRRLHSSSYAILGLGLFAAVLLISSGSAISPDPVFVQNIELTFPSIFAGLAELAIALAVLYNVWLMGRHLTPPESYLLYAPLFLGLAALTYGVAGVALQLPLPLLPSNLVALLALSVLAYSVGRYRVFIQRRIAAHDLPVSAFAVFASAGLFAYAGIAFDLPLIDLMHLSLLAVLTHSAYDLVQQYSSYLFDRQEARIRKEIRQLAQGVSSAPGLRGNLRQGLAILCRDLQINSAFVAQLEGQKATVLASINGYAPDTELPTQELLLEGLARPQGLLSEKNSWLAPAPGSGLQLGAIGVAHRWGNKEFSEADLFFLEDFAEQVGAMLLGRVEAETTTANGQVAPAEAANRAHQQAEDMLTALSFKPDPHLIAAVEEGLRNLNDYIKLGRSPLVVLLGAKGKTHIERGKAVQKILLDTLETLRPAGQPPPEPLPREWHSYVILHDAYVNDIPDRDIMGKLYVSEGTYYRARRKALHGVSKALMEMGASA
ncbi:MAG: hypothetical protein WEA61_01945 [Anaerolineales bacterium]